MPAEISVLNVENRQIIRVDSWDTTNRHWLNYFTINTDGDLELYSTAETQYEPTKSDLDNEQVSENVEKALTEAGFDLA